MLKLKLDEQQLSAWRQDHYLVLRSPFSPSELEALCSWTQTIQNWPESPGKWMQYFETIESHGERVLCRMENFIDYHDGFRTLFCGTGTLGVLEQLMGEPAVLFKEKINFKSAGSSGFIAHQDAPAFGTFGHDYHITMSVAVDSANSANGCLQMSKAVDGHILDQAVDGTLARAVEQKLSWSSVEMSPGDIIFFDSYIPHRSSANRSAQPRRAFFATYNRAADGEVRTAYFAHKRSVFPPECEREPGVDYSAAGPYNLGNPIR